METEPLTGEFQRLCRLHSEGDHPFFSKAEVSMFQALLESEQSLDRRAAIAWSLARASMRQGELESALEILETAKEEQPAGGDWHDDLAYMIAAVELRRGEIANCIENHSAASCILPLRPAGVHVRPEPVQRAGDLYESLWKQSPEDVRYRWLLNLTRTLSGEHPDRVPEAARWEARDPAGGPSVERWLNIATELGLEAWDLAGGAIMDDFDGDGLLDLISTSWGSCDPVKAWRNLGDGFEEVSWSWGLAEQSGALNVVHADYDNDGDLDLFLTRGAWFGAAGRIRNSLLENRLGEPEGRFVDVSAAAGVAYPAYPTQTATWGDYDNDGDLDLYVGNESSAGGSMGPGGAPGAGKPYPSQLFRNNGNATFTDVGRVAGVTNDRFAKGVAWGDYDNDGHLDLYVSNIGWNRLYRNRGDGTFVDVAESLGVEQPAGGSLATWFFDYDNDGDLDLWVSAYDAAIADVFSGYLESAAGAGHPRLFRNDEGRFTDVSVSLGLEYPLLPMGANYGDLDADGWPDVVLGTGAPNFDALMPNVTLRNRQGVAFDDVTFSSGLGHLQKGHGVAFGDIDNDGDLDLFHQLGGAYPYDAFSNALYQNPGDDASWVVLRLRGHEANRFAVGARIAVRIVEREQERTIHSVVGSGGSFGGSSLQAEIGLGEASRIEQISIRWPGSGLMQTVADVPLRSWIEITEGEPGYRVLEVERLRFEAVSGSHH